MSVRFVTNTTKESKDTLLNRLNGLGFDIKSEEVFTSLTAARRVVKKRNLRPLLFLGSDASKDFHGIDVNNPNAVVVGLAPDCFSYDMLNKAFRYWTYCLIFSTLYFIRFTYSWQVYCNIVVQFCDYPPPPRKINHTTRTLHSNSFLKLVHKFFFLHPLPVDKEG